MQEYRVHTGFEIALEGDERGSSGAVVRLTELPGTTPGVVVTIRSHSGISTFIRDFRVHHSERAGDRVERVLVEDRDGELGEVRGYHLSGLR